MNGQYLGKTPAQLRQMLSDQLDTLQQCGINAILFQVRAEGDALYKSNYEPWSRYLTGTQGVAPADGWDPLAWMVAECHKREMECHAWINPYRAKTKGTTALAQNHEAIRHPERMFEYDGLYIFNPAIAENRLHTCMVVEDILLNYDVDGIHMDDYFYPYPVKGLTYGLVHLACWLAVPLLAMYNGQRGRLKWIGKFFYYYYPAHMAVIGLLARCFQ